jgi:hypothetical protein
MRFFFHTALPERMRPVCHSESALMQNAGSGPNLPSDIVFICID